MPADHLSPPTPAAALTSTSRGSRSPGSFANSYSDPFYGCNGDEMWCGDLDTSDMSVWTSGPRDPKTLTVTTVSRMRSGRVRS